MSWSTSVWSMVAPDMHGLLGVGLLGSGVLVQRTLITQGAEERTPRNGVD